jgi:hypothetical protein
MADMADSLGNAFHRLRAYTHPHVKHAITQTFQQADEGDFESLDENESLIHLRRQALRIQRGEQISEITALLVTGPSPA